MLADRAAAAVLARRPLPLMLANRAAAAVLALSVLPLVAAQAILKKNMFQVI